MIILMKFTIHTTLVIANFNVNRVTGSRGGGKGSMPPLAYKNSHKNMATTCGGLYLMILEPLSKVSGSATETRFVTVKSAWWKLSTFFERQHVHVMSFVYLLHGNVLFKLENRIK